MRIWSRLRKKGGFSGLEWVIVKSDAVRVAFIAWEGNGDSVHAQGGMARGGEVDGGAKLVLSRGELAAW